MVLCFFDRFYVTVGDMHVLEFDSSAHYMEHMHMSLYDVGSLWLCDFSPTEEGVNPGPDSCSIRTLCKLWREADGSLTLKSARSFAICEAWEENNCSTGAWRLTSVRKRTTL